MWSQSPTTFHGQTAAHQLPRRRQLISLWFPNLYTAENMNREHEMSPWPVWVICLDVSSLGLLRIPHLFTEWAETEESLALCKFCSVPPQTLQCYLHCAGCRSRHSTTRATVTINSIQARLQTNSMSWDIRNGKNVNGLERWLNKSMEGRTTADY